MYLLDTVVVSETRKNKPHAGVMAWLSQAVDKGISICTMTVGEIQQGAENIRSKDPVFAEQIESWLETATFFQQAITLDSAVQRQWARYTYNRSPDIWQDAMIAATAKVHGLTVVTRNLRDFAAFDVPTLDPWDAGRRLR